MRYSKKSIFFLVLAVLLIVGFVVGMFIAVAINPSISNSPWLYVSAGVTFLVAIVLAIIGFSGWMFDMKENTKGFDRALKSFNDSYDLYTSNK